MQSLLSTTLVKELHEHTKLAVAKLVDAGIDPHLAVVLVGEEPASVKYVSIKDRVAKELGVIVSLYHLEDDTSVDKIAETLTFLSADPEVHGIILQLPLPGHISQEQVDTLLQTIAPEKDVDGLRGDWKKLTYSGTSIQALLTPQSWALPPMVSSVLSLLDNYNISVTDKKVVLVGRGRLVGQPLEEYLSKLGVDVKAVDEETVGILDIAKEADILIVAAGQPDLVTYQWVKDGAVVVDCNQDVHVDSVSQIASALAPAVGGVGPLTVAWLLHNTVQAAAQEGKR
jgi:methylenetetrahydrofolate dehydrogenase (NADP+)/methenyltetrahydrofolate cyclohydrolase